MSQPSPARRRFVAVSLKMRLGHGETLRWLSAVAAAGLPADELDVAVLPGFTAIASAARILEGTGIQYGAQDCFWEDSGPFTGEVSPAVLRELGCGYIEVGHAERRRLFGEDDGVVALKAAAVVRHGMTPIVCVGEPEPSEPALAATACIAQLAPVLAAIERVDRTAGQGTVIVAYEPVWAIGAPRPAGSTHIQHVVAALRDHLTTRGRGPSVRIIYGGSAGPGLITRVPQVDGLFLGRSALDVGRFAATAAEIAAATQRAAGPAGVTRH